MKKNPPLAALSVSPVISPVVSPVVSPVISPLISRVIAPLISLWALFLTPTQVQAFPAQFAVGPDNNQSLVLSTLRSAQKSLDINIYQLDHPAVVDAILDRISAGVVVHLLVEGHPVGGISPAGKYALAKIQALIQAQAQDQTQEQALIQAEKKEGQTSYSSRGRSHLYLMSAKNKIDRRYRFDHAKYMIVDQARTLVSSENLTQGGHATPGHKGSRGWDVLLEDPNFAKELLAIFTIDVNSTDDILDLSQDASYLTSSSVTPSKLKYPKLNRAQFDKSNRDHARSDETNTPVGAGDVRSTTLITSPDSRAGLVEMIRSAKITIEAEEMTLPLTWQIEPTKQIVPNPILTALVEASRRGVKVKLLLNDDSVFGKPGSHVSALQLATNKNAAPRNEQTREFIQQLAYCEKLPISAAVIDVNKAGITYIHNKGFIIDDEKVLISSINGTQNSVTHNREVAVLVESKEAANYFQVAFTSDWKNSLAPKEVSISCP